MTDPRQSDISDILGKMASGPIVRESKLLQVLRHLSSASVPIRVCADPRHLDRAVSTLKRYACAHSLKFPDYVPRHMRPKKTEAKRA